MSSRWAIFSCALLPSALATRAPAERLEHRLVDAGDLAALHRDAGERADDGLRHRVDEVAHARGETARSTPRRRSGRGGRRGGCPCRWRRRSRRGRRGPTKTTPCASGVETSQPAVGQGPRRRRRRAPRRRRRGGAPRTRPRRRDRDAERRRPGDSSRIVPPASAGLARAELAQPADDAAREVVDRQHEQDAEPEQPAVGRDDLREHRHALRPRVAPSFIRSCR